MEVALPRAFRSFTNEEDSIEVMTGDSSFYFLLVFSLSFRTEEFLRQHKDAYKVALESDSPNEASRATSVDTHRRQIVNTTIFLTYYILHLALSTTLHLGSPHLTSSAPHPNNDTSLS